MVTIHNILFYILACVKSLSTLNRNWIGVLFKHCSNSAAKSRWKNYSLRNNTLYLLKYSTINPDPQQSTLKHWNRKTISRFTSMSNMHHITVSHKSSLLLNNGFFVTTVIFLITQHTDSRYVWLDPFFK